MPSFRPVLTEVKPRYEGHLERPDQDHKGQKSNLVLPVMLVDSGLRGSELCWK